MTIETIATGAWPTDNIPPAELIGMAIQRDEAGHELNAKGDYAGAERHWRKAEFYRDLAHERSNG